MAETTEAATIKVKKPRRARRDREGRKRRHIVTPEGVSLPVELADRGERAAAVLIDLAFIAAVVVLGVLGIMALASWDIVSPRLWMASFIILYSFFVRTFYFTFFELRWQGRTPGKHLMGLRAIDRMGGRLTTDAVFARNLLREVELFLPITLLNAPQSGSLSDWAVLLSWIWIGVFVLMPFFNRDNLRAGDLVAGTWVVTAPKEMLLRDLAENEPTPTHHVTQEPVFRFTTEQLDAYGIYELQTLEDVLRQKGPNAHTMRASVSERIRTKIAWPTPIGLLDDRLFLESYYAALRAHLEAKMLLGVRREDKHDRR